MPMNLTFWLLSLFFEEVENLVPEAYIVVYPETYHWSLVDSVFSSSIKMKKDLQVWWLGVLEGEYRAVLFSLFLVQVKHRVERIGEFDGNHSSKGSMQTAPPPATTQEKKEVERKLCQAAQGPGCLFWGYSHRRLLVFAHAQPCWNFFLRPVIGFSVAPTNQGCSRGGGCLPIKLDLQMHVSQKHYRNLVKQCRSLSISTVRASKSSAGLSVTWAFMGEPQSPSPNREHCFYGHMQSVTQIPRLKCCWFI